MSGIEGLTAKIPWYPWNGQQRLCWWRRRSLGVAISESKKRFTFGRWEEGKGIFGGREVVQAADGSMRVGQPVFLNEETCTIDHKMDPSL